MYCFLVHSMQRIFNNFEILKLEESFKQDTANFTSSYFDLLNLKIAFLIFYLNV